MILNGFASKESTKRVSEKHKKFTYNSLGKTDLLVTEIGFGGYRIDVNSSTNKDALEKALLSGINLIDTSSTYTDGNSELLIGDVLKELTSSNKLLREAIVIVTKGGYIQGKNYALSQSRKKENKMFKDLVEFQNGLEHCIHPEFLEDQITRSLERLGLETIDIYLLHNPEYYLKWAKKNKLKAEIAKKEYYSRIKKAFEHLEKEVKQGRIKNYGISSNTFPSNSNDYDFTSLDKVIEISKEISKNNHFAVVEFPMNFAETNAYTKRNQSDNRTLLQLAEKEKIGVLTNRPLNVVYHNQLIPMTEPTELGFIDKETINKDFKNILILEETILKELHQIKDKEFSSKLENNLFVFEELGKSWFKFKGVGHWQNAHKQYFYPKLDYCKDLIKENLLDNEDFKIELLNYIDRVNSIFSLITSDYINEHLNLTITIKNNLTEFLPELTSAKNISNMAIRALRTTKGVNTVLLGMIKPQYVEDAIEELSKCLKKDFDWSKIDFETLLY